MSEARPQWRRFAVGLAVLTALIGVFLWRGLQDENETEPLSMLSAASSDVLRNALLDEPLDFEAAITQSILRRGCFTVTIHVALADYHLADVPREFGNGASPRANLYWGALFGVETHLANAGGWRRAYTDDGDNDAIIRRVVFHKRVNPTDLWYARGIDDAFDVYVLANAYPAARIVTAMEQPLRDAMTREAILLRIDNQDVAFGAGSIVSGYVGHNWMLDQYWDAFAALPKDRTGAQRGVFYLCSRSAVVLHAPALRHDLYPILFVRSQIVPEGYLVDGILTALLRGELDDAILDEAALAYAEYQKQASPDIARQILIR